MWAEINYLDSASEYREYLPNTGITRPDIRGDFELLSTSEDASKIYRWWILLPILGFVLIVILTHILNLI